jgi:hypothetical protein
MDGLKKLIMENDTMNKLYYWEFENKDWTVEKEIYRKEHPRNESHNKVGHPQTQK